MVCYKRTEDVLSWNQAGEFNDTGSWKDWRSININGQTLIITMQM